MTLLPLLLAAQLGSAVPTALPPAPPRLWSIAWQRQLVAPGDIPWEWKPQEQGGVGLDAAGTLLVIGTRDGLVRARDGEGHRLWDYETHGRIDAAPRVDRDAVYVGSSDGKLYALDAGSGKLRWAYDAAEEVGTTPALGGGLVLAMTLQDTLFAVDARTGAWKWHHRRETREGFTIRGAAAPVVVGDAVVAGYSDGTVAVLDLASGAVRWERKVAPSGDFMDVDSVRVQDGRVYVAAFSGAFFALDLGTGAALWDVRSPGASRVTVSGGVVVGVTTTQVLAIGARDGVVRWTTPLGGVPAGAAAVQGARVAVPTSGGLLFVDLATGQPLRRFNPGTGVSATPSWAGDRLYVLSNAGDLFALDNR